MKEIGEQLKQARLARNVQLEDISNRTRINVAYLQDIEEGKFDFLPRPYVIGFIKNYASHLGMNADELVAPLRQSPASPAAAATDVATDAAAGEDLQTGDAVKAPTYSRPVQGGINRVPHLKEVALAVAIVLVIALMLLVVSKSAEEPAAAMRDQAQAASASRTGELKEQPFQQVANEVAQKMATTQQKLQPPQPDLLLYATISDTAWIQVIVDDKDSSDSIYFPGSSRSWQAKIGFRLRVGDAGAVKLTLNGKQIEALGAPKQVAHLYITNAGVVEKKVFGSGRRTAGR